MSSDEVSALREDISTLRAIVEERGKAAAGNASMLRMIVGAVIVQLFATVYFAGQKTEMLDRLQRDVVAIQAHMEGK
jgi:hypothetical protein